MFAAAADFASTTITVETCLADSGRGRTFAAPVTREVFLSQSRSTVRTASGDETISESTVYDDPDRAGIYAPESRVTIDGTPTTVIKAAVNAIGDPDVDHVKVALR